MQSLERIVKEIKALDDVVMAYNVWLQLNGLVQEDDADFWAGITDFIEKQFPED